MELYTLDSQFRRHAVIDNFESAIWTERWRAYGDFELHVVSNPQTRYILRPGVRLAQNNSYRVMRIETVEDEVDDEGRNLLHIEGRSLEAILEDRVAKKSMADLTAEPTWKSNSRTPGQLARDMFNRVCRSGDLNAKDVLPYLVPGSMFPASTIPESTTLVRWAQEPITLYEAIRKLCVYYDMGFRLVRNFDTSQLYFDIYTGDNRTTQQTTLPPVVFSVQFGNIHNTTQFSSVQNSKNVAYVFSELGSAVVYRNNVDPALTGFNRHVILVTVPALDEDDAPYINTILNQYGKEALAEHRDTNIFDGEVDQNTSYIYGVNYGLGDLVEMRDRDDVVSVKRVTEQIFVSDSNGDRSYPTLSMGTYDSP
jgi:hypothetical protein